MDVEQFNKFKMIISFLPSAKKKRGVDKRDIRNGNSDKKDKKHQKEELYEIYKENWSDLADNRDDIIKEIAKIGVYITDTRAFSDFSQAALGDEKCLAIAYWLLRKNSSLADKIIETFKDSSPDLDASKLAEIFGWDQLVSDNNLFNVKELRRQAGYVWGVERTTKNKHVYGQYFSCSTSSTQNSGTDRPCDIIPTIIMHPYPINGYEFGFEAVEFSCSPTDENDELIIDFYEEYKEQQECKGGYLKARSADSFPCCQLSCPSGILNGEYYPNTQPFFKIHLNQDEAEITVKLTAELKYANIRCLQEKENHGGMQEVKEIPSRQKQAFINQLIAKKILTEDDGEGSFHLQVTNYKIKAQKRD